MIRILLILIALLWATPAWATFAFTSSGESGVTNPGFETTPGAEWDCYWHDTVGAGRPCHANSGQSTDQVHSGTYSYELYTRYYHATPDADVYDNLDQLATVTASTQYDFKFWGYRAEAGTSITLSIYPDAEKTGTPICTASVGTTGSWAQSSACTVPDTNTDTSLYINIAATATSANKSVWVDDLTVTPSYGGAGTKLTLTGGTGRTAKLIKSDMTEPYTATCTSTECNFGTIADGTYIIWLSDTGGTTVEDYSDWVSIANQDEWAWTDANHAPDDAWSIEILGDSDADGNCLDAPDAGCWTALKRGSTSEYMEFAPRIGAGAHGNDQMAGDTMSASSSHASGPAANGNDEAQWTRWLTTTAAPQWLCFDAGGTRSPAISRMSMYLGWSNEGYAPNATKIQSSTSGCNTGMSDVAGASITVNGETNFAEFNFDDVTDRYIRIYMTTCHSRCEIWEVNGYSQAASEISGDIDFLTIARADNTEGTFPAIRYDSYTTEADGSTTFVKDVAGWYDLSVNLKSMGSDVWKKEITITTDQASNVLMSNALYRYGTETCGYVAGTHKGACTTQDNDIYDWVVTSKPGFHAQAIGTPHFFGLTPDNGCSAKWVDHDFDPTTQAKNHRITGIESEEKFDKAFINYGRYDNGSVAGGIDKPVLKMAAGTPRTFDVYLWGAQDPSWRVAATKQVTAVAVANDQGALSESEQIFWGTGYSRLYSQTPGGSELDHCVTGYTDHHVARGYYADWGSWSVMGLNIAARTKQMLFDLRSADDWAGCGGGVPTICPDDSFSASPLTLRPGGTNTGVFDTAILLGYALDNNIVSICSPASDSCVTQTELDDLGTAIDTIINSSGEYWSSVQDIGLAGSEQDHNIDVTAFALGKAMAAYTALDKAGYAITASKLTNIKNNYKALYDATDGYLHAGIYGHCRDVTNASASGGAYRLCQGDFNATEGFGARFVVPSGHTNAVLDIGWVKQNYFGKLVVEKNGTPVTESPIDLYSASPAYGETTITETVSTGDVITFEATNSKNASSTNYDLGPDYVDVGGTRYETDSGGAEWACGGAYAKGDCLNGWTRGWKRAKSPRILFGEAMMRAVYGEPQLTDAQVISHVEKMNGGNQGGGTLLSFLQRYDDACFEGYTNPGAPYGPGSCKAGYNGGSYSLYDTMVWYMLANRMTTNDQPIWYKRDEQSDRFDYTAGTWVRQAASEPANYQQYTMKSSTASDIIVFEGVSWGDAEVYVKGGAGQGTAKFYFHNGTSYDAGTQVDLSTLGTGSVKAWEKLSQTYAANYKIKVEVISGAVEIDYIRTKTKPSDLLVERQSEEFREGPWTLSYLETDVTSGDYGGGGWTHVSNAIFYKLEGLEGVPGTDDNKYNGPIYWNEPYSRRMYEKDLVFRLIGF